MARGPWLFSRRYVVRIEVLTREFTRLPVDLQTFLGLCDGTRSRGQLEAASGLSAELFNRVIDKLERLDLVTTRKLKPPDLERTRTWLVAAMTTATTTATHPTRSMRMPTMPEPEPERPPEPAFLSDCDPLGVATDPAFALEEEAFFSRSIEHLLEPEERDSTRA